MVVRLLRKWLQDWTLDTGEKKTLTRTRAIFGVNLGNDRPDRELELFIAVGSVHF